jgi:hypothetical protein
LLVFDRFVARLSAALGDRVVLKGGLVVELRVKRARTTKDIDLRMLGDPDKALAKFQAAGRADLGDFLTFEVLPDARHPAIVAEGMRYPGRRYRVRALLASKLYGTPFHLDVAFAEPFAGDVEEVPGSDFLSFAGVPRARLRIYPLEAHIAEKLHAYTLPRTRLNSRVKDLPDIALLASVRSLDATTLSSAIRRTFRARDTHEVPASVPPPPATWGPTYAAMVRADGLRWATLEQLVQQVAAFLNPVLAGETGRWNPEPWSWASPSGEA